MTLFLGQEIHLTAFGRDRYIGERPVKRVLLLFKRENGGDSGDRSKKIQVIFWRQNQGLNDKKGKGKEYIDDGCYVFGVKLFIVGTTVKTKRGAGGVEGMFDDK